MAGYRLSPQQKRVWLLQQNSTAYRAQCAFLLEGNLQTKALREAVGKVVERHEIFSTTFAYVPGVKVPVQVGAEGDSLSWHSVDLRGQREDEQRALLKQHLADDGSIPFDFEKGPLARFSLLSFSEDRHILIATLPSLCADPATLDNLLPEISRSYEACLIGGEPSEELVQYVQFSEWQNELLESEEGETEKQFWRTQQLDNALALALPLEKLPRETPRYEPAALALELRPDLVRRVDAISSEYAVTSETLLLACWQTLLQRLTKQTVITTHVLGSGRVYEEMQEAMGLYATWPFVQSAFEATIQFDELLAHLNESVSEAHERQEYYSWEEFLASAGVEVPAEQALCYGFESERRPLVQSAAGVRFSVQQKYACTERFKLRLSCALTEDSLSLTFHYDPAFYTAETIERHITQFEEVLRSVLENPRVRVAQLDVLSERERRQVLEQWNDTRREYPRTQCLHELFEEQVERTPEAVAVVFKDERLTFRELNQRANRLAHYLQKLGVAPDAPVVLFMERSVEAIVGLLGILKAGGAYVPLEPAHLTPRLAFMLEDVGAPMLLTQERLLERLPEHNARVVCVDSHWPEIANESEQQPDCKATPEHLAYIIYTSGSTGRPKGTGVKHGSVVNLVTGLRESVYAGQGSPLRVSVNASLSFDSSVKQVVQLLSGHALYVIPEEIRIDGEGLIAFMQEQELEVLDCTPSQLKLLLGAGLTQLRRPFPKLVLVGGEALDEPTWRLLTNCGWITFYNVYGPTECTVDTTVCRITGEIEAPVIGRPIANTQVYILDEQMRVLPVGVGGELYIGGDGLARGYLNQPHLTAEKFVPHPFGRTGGERVYRTGDRARWLEDGSVEFLGRTDNQVKIRGYRIELGEVEAALRQQADVSEAVALVQERGAEKRLVAYVVCEAEESQEEQQESAEARGRRIRERVGKQLPEYMALAAVVLVKTMPLTPNGKVDRNALLGVGGESEEGGQRYVAPQTAVEEIMAGIWGEVLGVERVGAEDNFFDIGGHSLLATQIISRVRGLFQIELPLRSLFESPTVASLSLSVEHAIKIGAAQDIAPPIERVERSEALPLSFAQQRLWFLDQLMPNSSVYIVPTILSITGQFNVAAFKQSLDEVIRRHETLRTTFAVKEGKPVQVIAPAQSLELPVIDLSGLPVTEREVEVEARIVEETQRPFDLSRGPLLRATLLQLGPQEHVLLFAMHHIVSDDWSKGVLIREVAALYEAFSKGLPSPLPERSLQYADFAHWQRQWLTGDVLESQLAYWRRQLGGTLTPLELPTDHPRPASPSFRGAHIPVRLPGDLTEKLKTLSRREGATLFMTLLAAFKTLLHRYTSRADIIVGTPIANRTRGEIEDLIGFFVNTLVLRSDFSGNPTFCELLKRVRDVTLGAYAHQDLPFEKLVEDLNLSRNLGQTPFLQVVFTLQNAPMPPLELSGLTLEVQSVDNGTAKFDLVLNMAETEEGLVGWLEYNRDLFEDATVSRMQRHFERLLVSIVEQPEARLDDLEILTDEEVLALEQIVEVADFEGSFSF